MSLSEKWTQARAWMADKIMPDAVIAEPAFLQEPEPPRLPERTIVPIHELARQRQQEAGELRNLALPFFCSRFLNYMRDNQLYGYHTSEDIDCYVDTFAAEKKYHGHSFQQVRSMLKEMPGVASQKMRLRDNPELRAIMERTGRDRSVIYRIASRVEMEKRQQKQEKRRKAGTVPSKAGQSPDSAHTGATQKPGPKAGQVRSSEIIEPSQHPETLAKAA